LPRGAQAAADHHGGGVPNGVEPGVDAGLQEHVVAPGLVHRRAAGPARGQHVDDGRQLGVVDPHLCREVLRSRPGRGHADSDRLAHVPHLALRQHRLRGRLEARQGGVGDDRQHAVQVIDGKDLCLVPRRLADGQDARVRERAADEGEVAHARKPDVGDELAFAAQIAVVLAADFGRCRTASPSTRMRWSANWCR